MKRLILAATMASIVICGSAPGLHAQGNETSAAARYRNNCRLAARVLQTGLPATRLTWAIGYAASCESEGPALLARQWQTSQPRAEQLEALVRASGRIRDDRLYRQLRTTAQDRCRPDGVRVGAMLVLAKYVDPGSAVWLTDLIPPDTVKRIPLIAASTTSTSQLVGTQPVSGRIAPSVQALLDTIAASRTTEPREVWYAAAVLARRVRSDMELGRAR